MLCTGRLRAVPASSVDDDVIRGLIELCAMQREYTEYICHHDRVHNSIVADGQGVFFTWRLSHRRERERERERESQRCIALYRPSRRVRGATMSHTQTSESEDCDANPRRKISHLSSHIYSCTSTHMYLYIDRDSYSPRCERREQAYDASIAANLSHWNLSLSHVSVYIHAYL